MDDVYKACERFERLGVEFVKKPDDGKTMLPTTFTSSILCGVLVLHMALISNFQYKSWPMLREKARNLVKRLISIGLSC